MKQRKLDYLQQKHRPEQVFLPGFEYVGRDDFMQTLGNSLGVPLDITEARTNDRVMILYQSTSSYPDRSSILESNSTYFIINENNNLSDPIIHPHRKRDVVLSTTKATKNCNNLHVVLTDQARPHQCLAIVGQYESFHLQKLMRASTKPDPQHNSKDRFSVDPSYPLRPVNRGMKMDGGRSVSIPTEEHMKANWRSLAHYLQSVEGVLKELQPIAKEVSEHNNNNNNNSNNHSRNTVVVMVCNFGQSELLMNCE